VLRPEVIDLNEVVAGVRLLIERLIGEDIRLLIEPAAEPLRVLADRSQLEQVIMNLAVNARDAMPRGGTLAIRAALVRDTVRLTVRDTGTGMTPEVLARLFEPFFTTKEVGKGTGLGLSTVYGIVKQSRGHIEVTSRPGQGSTFVVTLPAAGAAHTPREGEPAEMPAGTETILLVEDEREVRELVRNVLSQLGYDVIVALDGTAALDLARRHGSAISLLLTDIVMPHMSGPDLYRRLAMLLPGVSVLYMSGYTGDEVLAQGVSRETAAFLQKPFTPAALARTVRSVLDSAGEARRTG
jgi:two-component system, cell cycle sensor histidine kinase and response regulator CckA